MKKFFTLLLGITVALGAIAAPVSQKIAFKGANQKVELKKEVRSDAKTSLSSKTVSTKADKAAVARRVESLKFNATKTQAKARKAQANEIEIVAHNLEIDDSYAAWFGIWRVLGSNEDYSVEVYLAPDSTFTSIYDNYDSETASIWVTPAATGEEITTVVESASLSTSEAGDLFTAVASDSLGNTYKISIDFVMPDRIDTTNVEFSASASMTYYEADGDYYFYAKNDSGYQVALDIVTESLVGSYDSEDFLLEYTKIATPEGDIFNALEAKATITQVSELVYNIEAELFAKNGTTYMCKLFYEIPSVKDTVALDFGLGAVRSYLEDDGSFLFVGQNDEYYMQVNPIAKSDSAFDGTYTVADLDPSYSLIEDAEENQFAFVENEASQFSVAQLNDHQWTVKGALLATNSVLYTFDFVVQDVDYVEPLEAVTDTVSFEAEIGQFAEFFDYDGSFQIIAYRADSTLAISLNPITFGTFDGTFGYADLDKDYSYIIKYVDTVRTSVAFAEWEGTGFTSSLNGNILSIEGSLAAYDGVLYQFKLSGEIEVDTAAAGGDTIVLVLDEDFSIEYYASSQDYFITAYNAEGWGAALDIFEEEGKLGGTYETADFDASYTQVLTPNGLVYLVSGSASVSQVDSMYIINAELLMDDNNVYQITMIQKAIEITGDTISGIEFDLGQAYYLNDYYASKGQQLANPTWQIDVYHTITDSTYDARISVGVATASATSIAGIYDVAQTFWTSIELPIDSELVEVDLAEGTVKIEYLQDYEGYAVYNIHVEGLGKDGNYYDLSYAGPFICMNAATGANIAMTDVLSGLEVLRAPEFIRVVDNSLVVDAQGLVQIYNVAGQLLYNANVAGQTTINGLKRGQVLIVRVNDKAAKVVF